MRTLVQYSTTDAVDLQVTLGVDSVVVGAGSFVIGGESYVLDEVVDSQIVECDSMRGYLALVDETVEIVVLERVAGERPPAIRLPGVTILFHLFTLDLPSRDLTVYQLVRVSSEGNDG